MWSKSTFTAHHQNWKPQTAAWRLYLTLDTMPGTPCPKGSFYCQVEYTYVWFYCGFTVWCFLLWVPLFGSTVREYTSVWFWPIALIGANTISFDSLRSNGHGFVKCAVPPLIAGPCLFSGYFRDPDATREVLGEDGWFHTGEWVSKEVPYCCDLNRTICLIPSHKLHTGCL
jgi:hypothetical protein